ncbi:MAG: hypothetical protein KKF30_10045 [Proteobacteria bacterium]|nr:hypothetical protein [Pseudomonadota bacterium]MBU4468882.1 hypothetical protein [Pseudomonadota bacterium]MCG2750875.1 hypothetical protein [Desulfobacteraceae bacterium]
MPYQIEYIEPEGGLIVSWMGKINGDEVIQSYHERFSPLERLKKLRYIITDYTDMTDFELAPEDIKTIAGITNHAAQENRHVYAAAIMPTDISFGLARMFQFYADDDTTGWETLVTRTRKEAEDWLRENLRPDLTFKSP